MIARLVQRLRQWLPGRRPAPVGPGEGTLQLTPLASGKLRLTVSAPVIELDPAAAMDIARTLRTLALRLGATESRVVLPGGSPKEFADRLTAASGGRRIAGLGDDPAVARLLRGAYPVKPSAEGRNGRGRA